MENIENELVKKYFKIKNPHEDGIFKVIDLEDAVEIATVKIWKHLEKNEFPKEKQKVLCVFKETFMVQEDIYFNENKEYFKNLYIAWCALPIYKA